MTERTVGGLWRSLSDAPAKVTAEPWPRSAHPQPPATRQRVRRASSHRAPERSRAGEHKINAMAREEHQREDLLREATALVERAEIRLPGCEAAIVVGFRRDGAPSFFFGDDFVVQFNPHHELRRGYWNGRLVK